MPLLMNMKMDGILGDSKSYNHKGWFEVLSWNWGMTSNRKTAQGINGDKTLLNEISIIKSIGIDSSSIRLLFAQGKKIPYVDFSIVPSVGKKEVQTKYVDIRIEDVLIKSIVTGGSADDNFFKEHITLLFEKIKFQYSRNPVRNGEDTDNMPLNKGFSWNVSESAEWMN
jgi:type VI secretion system secreted protein Hcp